MPSLHATTNQSTIYNLGYKPPTSCTRHGAPSVLVATRSPPCGRRSLARLLGNVMALLLLLLLLLGI
jgi:hypothetical protein